MRVQVESAEYDVRFRSHFITNKIGKNVRNTVCSICLVNKEIGEKDIFSQVNLGIAIQNSKDQDVRRIGQKLALAKAVCIFPKDKRINFWKTCKLNS